MMTPLDDVVTLLDDIAYARATSATQAVFSCGALDDLIRDHPEHRENLVAIRDFLLAQKDLSLDVGMRLRLRAEQMADWCRDLLEEEVA